MGKRGENIPDDPIELLIESVESFKKSGVNHALYGGLALATYGTPRETIDVDHVIRKEDTDSAIESIKGCFDEVLMPFRDMAYGGLCLTRLTVINKDSNEATTIDLVSSLDEKYTNEVLERAYTGKLRGHEIRVVTPEDFVILKVLFTREIDIEDAISVMTELYDSLDMNYIEKTLNEIMTRLPDKKPIISERYHRVSHGVRSALGKDFSL